MVRREGIGISGFLEVVFICGTKNDGFVPSGGSLSLYEVSFVCASVHGVPF